VRTVVALASLVLAGSAAAAPGTPSATVTSGIVRPGQAVMVRLAGAPPHRPLAIELVPSAFGAAPVRLGRVVPDRRGRATLVARIPALAADVYRPAVAAPGRLVPGRGRLVLAALPPAGFGPAGGPGCSPLSPAIGHDVFGTSVGTQLWAFPFADLGPGGAATLADVVGQQTKIVFRMTAGIPTAFYAVSPDGTRIAPAWMQPHSGSSWTRPGYEWGAGFVFDRPGCWRIHAALGAAAGDLWLSVVS
jgi:hypothetical protein